MKKLIIGIIASLFSLNVLAMQIVDVNNPYVFLTEGNSHTITHDLSDDGVPGMYQVTSGNLMLGFSDGYFFGDFAWDMAQLSGSGLSGTFEVGGTHLWGYDIRTVGLGADGISSLNSNGMLEVTLTAISTPYWYQGYNDFWWKTSKLTVNVEEVSVSEPATISLLGLGLICLGLFRRRVA